MMASADMSTPVTRGELREELARFEERLEQKLDQKLEEKLEEKLEQKLDQRLAHLATKAEIAKLATKEELEIWGGALLARLTEFTERSEKRLLIELARHLKASEEELSARLAVIDEKYADLPVRVRQLETEVFAPRRRRS